MQGWVIVYLPGGDVYQMLSPDGAHHKRSLKQRVVRTGLKTLVACVQMYWWLKS